MALESRGFRRLIGMDEVERRLGAKGPVAMVGYVFDESFARTHYRQLSGPYGRVTVMKAEDLLVERVLVAVYPQPHEPARACARMLIGVALRREVEMDWSEVKRVANLPEYRNLKECEALIQEVADELKIRSHLHCD